LILRAATVACGLGLVGILPAMGAELRKDGYLTDTNGEVVIAVGATATWRLNVCVRTMQWTPALAVPQCEADMNPRGRPAPPKTETRPKGGH
jgi:hypothetical protein